MDETSAMACLGALAQSTRLTAFRLLMAREPVGAPAGEVARLAGVPQNTMSAHLAVLAGCGLVSSNRAARSVVYRADVERLRALAVFLLADCCGGRPDECARVVAALACAEADGPDGCVTETRRKRK